MRAYLLPDFAFLSQVILESVKNNISSAFSGKLIVNVFDVTAKQTPT